jgi:MoaA/NifB/PqqE/SkfB family radical SAM enzyme
MAQFKESEDPAAALLEREIEREVAEVEAAIELVRSGVATVVTIANLRHGDEVFDLLYLAGAGPDAEFEPYVKRGEHEGELTVRLLSA